MHFPKKRTEFGKKTFAYIGPLIWQNISTQLKSLSYENFKKRLKIHLINKY